MSEISSTTSRRLWNTFDGDDLNQRNLHGSGGAEIMRLPDPVVFNCMGLRAKCLLMMGYDRLVPAHQRERLQTMEHYCFPDTSIPTAYGPYSHAVVAGDFVFLAGQIARDPVSGQLIEGDITAQTARCLEIVSDILKSLGLSLADVVRTTVFLSDIGNFDAMNAVYSAAFQAPYPVRSTPQVTMPFGALVGIEVTAYRGRQTKALEVPKVPMTTAAAID